MSRFPYHFISCTSITALAGCGESANDKAVRQIGEAAKQSGEGVEKISF